MGLVVEAFDEEILASYGQSHDDSHCAQVRGLVGRLGRAWRRFPARSALFTVSAKDPACRSMLDFSNAGFCVAIVSVFWLGYGMT